MSQPLITAIGLCAGTLTTAAWLPQVFRTWRTRTARDFSWTYLVMFATGVLTWAIYGVLRRDIAVLGANVITLVLVVTLIVIKFRERP